MMLFGLILLYFIFYRATAYSRTRVADPSPEGSTAWRRESIWHWWRQFYGTIYMSCVYASCFLYFV